MEKSMLKETILDSYLSLKPYDYNALYEVILKLESECSDSSEMAEKFLALPEYKILNEAFLRKRAQQIKSKTGTIAVIAVIYFICSIISIIYFATKFL